MKRNKMHDVKCWPDFFQPLFEDKKTFELRKDDRNYNVGDIMLIREWDPPADVFIKDHGYSTGNNGKGYTGRFVSKKITYILKGRRFGLKKGYVILGLSRRISKK